MEIAAMIVGPLCLFLLVVAPIWLVMHYRSKRQVSQGLTEEEYRQLRQLAEQSEHMTKRIQTLEAILDAESPDWRKQA
ncbi:envelope stress response membrane protein PspB [Neiella marina]|uniref:Envelope stress response membrane protein PspB n=1 Tax=Neiella holothuriorum TaxID=2870530 RepID=A0ABS7EDF1_9GAMM|nr:envelope stress response membrane protein PspB [Neiella holothuriorum]MBW8190371.1 envelope stress response membrane protein PspB [Neiella holothuriorum]